MDELLREARDAAAEGGKEALGALLSSKAFSGRLDALGPEERRYAAFYLDGVREDAE